MDAFKKIFGSLFDSISFYTPVQVHSDTVKVVGNGVSGRHVEIAASDALVYRKNYRDLKCLYVKTADCVPVLLADTARQVVAVLHSGWRGTLKNIVRKTVERMRDLGASLPDVRAAIGPSICGRCYRVPRERALEFSKTYGFGARSDGDRRSTVDLDYIVRRQLRYAGITEENIDGGGNCTVCDNGRFYSYRAEKETKGRTISYICL